MQGELAESAAEREALAAQLDAVERQLAAATQRAEQAESVALRAQQAAAPRDASPAAGAPAVAEAGSSAGWEGGDLLSGDLLDLSAADLAPSGGGGPAGAISPAVPGTPTAAVLSNPAFSPDRETAELHRQVPLRGGSPWASVLPWTGQPLWW